MPKSCKVLLIHKNVRYTHFSSLRWNFVSRPKKNKITNNSNNNNKNKVSAFHCGMGKMFRMRVLLVWDQLSSRQPNFWPWLSHPFSLIFIVVITIWTIHLMFFMFFGSQPSTVLEFSNKLGASLVLLIKLSTHNNILCFWAIFGLSLVVPFFPELKPFIKKKNLATVFLRPLCSSYNSLGYLRNRNSKIK